MLLSSEPLEIPALCLVVLIGVQNEVRGMFAAQHFAPAEVCLTLEAAGVRLSRGLLSVLNAPHLRAADRAGAVLLAREQNVRAVAVILDPPLPGADARTRQALTDLHRELGGPESPGLRVEGFGGVHRLLSPEAIQAVKFWRVPLPPDRRELTGPFDLIGDVHGCLPELLELLSGLGYVGDGDHITPPGSRTAVFLGDLTDRGPDSPGVLRLVMGMVAAGTALCVTGNHDAKLLRVLGGHKVQVTHGLEVTLEQLAGQPSEYSDEVRTFLAGLPSHLLLDGGRLVAAHAGLPERLQGRESRRVWAFALYGDVDRSAQERSAQTEGGPPVRRDWAAGYSGAALVVYGHTPVVQPRWLNNTVNLDTGCVYGGQLSALRYPERTTLSVPAQAIYREAASAPQGERPT